MTAVKVGEVMGDNVVIFENGERRVDGSGTAEARRPMVEKRIEALRALIQSNPSKIIN